MKSKLLNYMPCKWENCGLRKGDILAFNPSLIHTRGGEGVETHNIKRKQSNCLIEPHRSQGTK
jgi:ectoine hydroxylase-related dioxygenase (phytanoyl-CoA dioxygenase family)